MHQSGMTECPGYSKCATDDCGPYCEHYSTKPKSEQEPEYTHEKQNERYPNDMSQEERQAYFHGYSSVAEYHAQLKRFRGK